MPLRPGYHDTPVSWVNPAASFWFRHSFREERKNTLCQRFSSVPENKAVCGFFKPLKAYPTSQYSTRQFEEVVYKCARHVHDVSRSQSRICNTSHFSFCRCYFFVNTVICIYCKWWRPWAGTEHGAAGSRHRARHRARHSTSKGLRYLHSPPVTKLSCITIMLLYQGIMCDNQSFKGA